MKKLYYIIRLFISVLVPCLIVCCAGCATYHGWPCWVSYKDNKVEQYNLSQPDWTDSRYREQSKQQN